MVRPYLVAYEQAAATEQIRLVQRERRTAAALATLGIDYEIGLVLTNNA